MTRTRLLPIWGKWRKMDNEPKAEPLTWYIKTKQLKAHLRAMFWRRIYCSHPEFAVHTIWPNGTTAANDKYRKPLKQFCIRCFSERPNLARVK